MFPTSQLFLNHPRNLMYICTYPFILLKLLWAIFNVSIIENHILIITTNNWFDLLKYPVYSFHLHCSSLFRMFMTLLLSLLTGLFLLKSIINTLEWLKKHYFKKKSMLRDLTPFHHHQYCFCILYIWILS